jgi:hypothetical protein
MEHHDNNGYEYRDVTRRRTGLKFALLSTFVGFVGSPFRLPLVRARHALPLSSLRQHDTLHPSSREHSCWQGATSVHRGQASSVPSGYQPGNNGCVSLVERADTSSHAAGLTFIADR